MANFAFVPQMVRHAHFSSPAEQKGVHVASISRLINVILEDKDDPGDYFGVVFSVHH
ncbi:hypothetical protein M405DRAFT_863527 [Rhizopogon salebrosus TDB-379]|nr:hypothetical protein M405DRAFT_863527 [Rhizopogon salebrosus TDB-379]